mgnify:CR=1 FL=1
MKTINFENPHGVIVQYTIASAIQRIAAFIIDVIIYFLAILLIVSIVTELFSFTGFLAMILVVIFFFAPLMVEVWTNGQSIGKIAIGLSVVAINGKHCTMVEYFTRYVLKLIEILLSFGLLPIVLISFSKYGQSLGDKFAGTTVIVKKKNPRFSLNEIRAIQSAKEYNIEFPMVKRLNEADVIVLKNLLQEHGGASNHEILALAANKVKSLLKVENSVYSNSEFLNKVITEYIILTR